MMGKDGYSKFLWTLVSQNKNKTSKTFAYIHS